MRTTPAITSWLVRLKLNPRASLHLFCFPYGGGGASIFRSWPDSLPTSIEVCPVQLPGRESRLREEPFAQVSSLVRAIAKALLLYLDRPFAFFGHSMGALIGFELSRQLRREHGLKLVHLFVSGCRAPQLPDPDPPTYDLPEPKFLEELRRLNGTPKEVLKHPELMQLMLPLLRADFEAVQTYAYSPAPPLDCPITVFGGLQDNEVKREYLEGWREQTTGSFSLQMLPGDHFFLHTAQPLLLHIITQELHQHVRRTT
jgi:medium-chain acyl-[acyl-carrier-protein] hydrolase